jgi:hypothetical protein
VVWRNRVTLQSRVHQDGDSKRVELRAAPPVPIRYTTDGSDPKLSGGHYDDPFAVPSGTRYVLAVAEHRGIVSDVHQREIDWNQDPVDKPIDKAGSATWRPRQGLSFSTTHTAYGFINRLRKHGVKAGIQRIAVLDGQWAELQLADGMSLDPEQIEATVEQLRSLLSEGEVNIDANFLWFPTGQQLLDYVRDIKVELNRNEVEP